MRTTLYFCMDEIAIFFSRFSYSLTYGAHSLALHVVTLPHSVLLSVPSRTLSGSCATLAKPACSQQHSPVGRAPPPVNSALPRRPVTAITCSLSHLSEFMSRSVRLSMGRAEPSMPAWRSSLAMRTRGPWSHQVRARLARTDR